MYALDDSASYTRSIWLFIVLFLSRSSSWSSPLGKIPWIFLAPGGDERRRCGTGMNILTRAPQVPLCLMSYVVQTT